MKKINYIFILLLLLVSNKVYANTYNPSKVVLEKEAEIRYLDDDDKKIMMDKFGLAEYDGAVIVTNDDSITYVVDYSESNMHSSYVDPYMLKYEEIENSYNVPGYIASYNGEGYNDLGVMDIKRDSQNNLILGYTTGLGGEFGYCGRISDHNQQCSLTTLTFEDEGLSYDVTDSLDGISAKFFIYYIKDISNSKLHFKTTSKKVTSFIPTAIRNTSLINNDKHYVLDESEPKNMPTYRGIFNESDKESIMDITDMSYYEGYVDLISKDGFNFKLDLDKTNYDPNDIYEIDIEYYGVSRDGTKLVAEDNLFDDYRYAFGKLYDYDDDYNLKLTDTTLANGIRIKSSEESTFTAWSCPENEEEECVEITVVPNFVTIKIYTLAGGWNSFEFVYDTDENRSLFDFEKIEKIAYDIPIEDYVTGDMNGNGKIDLPDIIMLLKKYLGLDEVNNSDKKIGDIDNDGVIGLKDIIMLLKTYLGLN